MAEPEEVTQQLPEAASDDSDGGGSPRPSRGSSIAAVVCLVLAGLLTTPAAVAYWGQRTLNDTERYVQTVSPLVESEEVQDVITSKVTGAIEQQVNVEEILDNVFSGVIADRPRLQQLVGPLAGAVNGLIEREVGAFVASEEFADFWREANARAQQALLRVLQGDDSGLVTLQDSQVVLNLDDVIEKVRDRLVDRGLTILANAPTPHTDRQIVLVDAPQVQELRTIYAFGNPVAKWLLPFALILYLAAFVLSRRRARMTVTIGAVILANAALAMLALSIGRQLFVNELAGTAFGPASRVFFDTLLSYLDRGQQTALWLGIVLIAAGWFAGANRYGTSVRTTISGGLTGLGGRLKETPVAGSGRWCAANQNWLRAAAVGVGIVILLWGNQVSPERLWWSLAVVLLGMTGLQVLIGAGSRSARQATVSG